MRILNYLLGGTIAFASGYWVFTPSACAPEGDAQPPSASVKPTSILSPRKVDEAPEQITHDSELPSRVIAASDVETLGAKFALLAHANPLDRLQLRCVLRRLFTLNAPATWNALRELAGGLDGAKFAEVLSEIDFARRPLLNAEYAGAYQSELDPKGRELRFLFEGGASFNNRVKGATGDQRQRMVDLAAVSSVGGDWIKTGDFIMAQDLTNEAKSAALSTMFDRWGSDGEGLFEMFTCAKEYAERGVDLDDSFGLIAEKAATDYPELAALALAMVKDDLVKQNAIARSKFVVAK